MTDQARYIIRYLDYDPSGNPVPMEVVVPTSRDDGRRGWEICGERAPECLRLYSGRRTIIVPMARLISIDMLV